MEFRVVPDGLAEDEVVSFVNNLMEQSRVGGDDDDRQGSLRKLAEQTVVEADKLAESIQQQARKDAEEASAKVLAAAEEQAQVHAQRIIKRAERDADSQSRQTTAKAEKEAQDSLQEARERAANIEAEAKVEAEYIVRRMTVKFVEELRSAVTDTASDMLPTLDAQMKALGHGGVSGEATEAPAAIEAPRRKSRSS